MSKIDREERDIVRLFEKGKLESVATKAELARLKAAARATAQQRTKRPPARKRNGA